MEIFEIPRKFKVTWNSEVRAIIDTVSTYMITEDEFRDAVLGHGLPFAKKNNGQAWIIDSTKATGLFKQTHIDIINNEIFPAFARNGIKYFITTKTGSSIFTELTVQKFSALTGPHGIKLIEVADVEQAILWLKNQK